MQNNYDDIKKNDNEREMMLLLGWLAESNKIWWRYCEVLTWRWPESSRLRLCPIHLPPIEKKLVPRVSPAKIFPSAPRRPLLFHRHEQHIEYHQTNSISIICVCRRLNKTSHSKDIVELEKSHLRNNGVLLLRRMWRVDEKSQSWCTCGEMSSMLCC